MDDKTLTRLLRQLNVGLWVNALLWCAVFGNVWGMMGDEAWPLKNMILIGLVVGGVLQHWTYHRLVKHMRATA